MIKPLNWLAMLALAAICWQCAAEAKTEAASPPVAEANETLIESSKPIRYFTTLTAQPDNESQAIPVTGRVEALESLPIIAEVQGQVQANGKLLKEGVSYKKGETLIQLDDQRYRLGLQAQRSQLQASLVQFMSQIQLDYPTAHPAWDAYLRAFDPSEILKELPVVSDDQLRYFLSAQGVFATYYNIKSAEELLPKYRIRAPFSGIITEGALSAGTVVSPGAPLGRLSRTDIYEFKVNISSADIDRIKTGQKISLRQPNSGKEYSGTVHRIGGTIDPGTQAIPVFLRLRGTGLRDGLFLEARMADTTMEEVVELPMHALTRDNQVHLIRDSTIVLQAVEVAHYGENRVWVKGLSSGALVVTEKRNEPIVGLRALPKK